MDRPYRDFAELTLYARRGYDYQITVRDASADITVAAIHAGHTEPLTGELATAIAGDDHNLYRLDGLRADGRDRLRVPISRFDDVRLTNLMDRSEIGLSILGTDGETEAIHLGGGNRALVRALVAALQAAGFETAEPAAPGPAHSPARFVNRPRHAGVQLELTRALRSTMVDAPLEGEGWSKERRTERFERFVRAVRETVGEYMATLAVDLDATMEKFERSTAQIRRVIPLGDGGNGHHSSNKAH